MERMAFLAGFIAIPAFVQALVAPPVATNLTSNIVLVVFAGLLVGLGTRIGNGCTSGHGVCGISWISPRGIAATLVYVAAGTLMVMAQRNLMGRLLHADTNCISLWVAVRAGPASIRHDQH
tara:strand:+ start:1156 stop:1518 length:363 start_codon:yes stop_codon:yes gene_type:complete